MGMKESYEHKLRAQLEEWNAEIERLKERAGDVEANAQTEYKEQIEELQMRQQEVQAKLTELQEASGSAWEDIKAGIEMSWHNLDMALKSARSRFK